MNRNNNYDNGSARTHEDEQPCLAGATSSVLEMDSKPDSVVSGTTMPFFGRQGESVLVVSEDLRQRVKNRQSAQPLRDSLSRSLIQ